LTEKSNLCSHLDFLEENEKELLEEEEFRRQACS